MADARFSDFQIEIPCRCFFNELIEQRVTGLLCRADPVVLADALLELSSQPLLAERLARSALAAARRRTWERTLERLADGYRRALSPMENADTGEGARAA